MKELNRLRLGKVERTILLLAPGPEDDFKRIGPEKVRRSAYESNTRAVRKLYDHGLIETGVQWYSKNVKVPEYEYLRSVSDTPVKKITTKSGYECAREYSRTVIRLSNLGKEVVDCYRNELQTGKPLRWAKFERRKPWTVKPEKTSMSP